VNTRATEYPRPVQTLDQRRALRLVDRSNEGYAACHAGVLLSEVGAELPTVNAGGQLMRF